MLNFNNAFVLGAAAVAVFAFSSFSQGHEGASMLSNLQQEMSNTVQGFAAAIEKSVLSSQGQDC